MTHVDRLTDHMRVAHHVTFVGGSVYTARPVARWVRDTHQILGGGSSNPQSDPTSCPPSGGSSKPMRVATASRAVPSPTDSPTISESPTTSRSSVGRSTPSCPPSKPVSITKAPTTAGNSLQLAAHGRPVTQTNLGGGLGIHHETVAP